MAENNEILQNNRNEQIGGQFERKNEKSTETIVDLKKDVIIPREVENWLKKVEQDPDLNRQDPNNDDSALQSIATTVTKITLPIDKKKFSTGFTKTVGDAGRWLSEFVFRLIKKNKGNIKFNEK